MIIVGKSKPCDFFTIGEAIKAFAASDYPIYIYIKSGVYQEKLLITRPNITLIGECADDTIITYGDYAKMTGKNNLPIGTFETATLRTDTYNFTAKNLTVKNSAGNGKDCGQAVAVYADGDKISFYHCIILGSQDTLFTAPLPPTNKNGTLEGLGSKALAPRTRSRQYYYKCLINGDVDFIFGGATAFFEECEIFSQNVETENDNNSTKGYITAPCTPEGQRFGYVFDKCRFLSDCPPQTVYLGRPWRMYAKTVFINCYLDNHIKSEGFDDWNNPQSHSTAFFAEYQCYGKGSKNIDKRVKWSHQLTDEQAKEYDKNTVLGDWTPNEFERVK